MANKKTEIKRKARMRAKERSMPQSNMTVVDLMAPQYKRKKHKKHKKHK